MPDDAQGQLETQPEAANGVEAAEATVSPDTAVAPVAEPEVSAVEPEVAFSWQASEFVHHHKSILWYGVVVAAVVVLAILAIVLHLWLEIGVFIAAGAAVMVYANMPPRTLLYELSTVGIKVEGKLYPYEGFRSFGVITDEEWHSIDLEPAKRFSPRLVLLFDTADVDEIVGHLERHVPREDRELDMIERITRYVRF